MYRTLSIATLLDSLVTAVDAARVAAAGNARWQNAINTGFDWLLLQDTIHFNKEYHELEVCSPSGKTYHANGSCQCDAFVHGEGIPCWHRAAARLVRRALEINRIEGDIVHEAHALTDALRAEGQPHAVANANANTQVRGLLATAAAWDAEADAERVLVEAQRRALGQRIAAARVAVLELF